MEQNSQPIRIFNLKEKVEHLPEIAQWVWDFWEKDHHSLEDVIKLFEKIIKNKNDALPQLYVAEYENNLAGVIWVHKDGIPTREELTPTATRLFVKKEYRGKSVDKSLLYFSANLVRNLGYENIYFYTRLKNYYDRKEEVEYMSEIIIDGKLFHIYSCNFKKN